MRPLQIDRSGVPRLEAAVTVLANRIDWLQAVRLGYRWLRGLVSVLGRGLAVQTVVFGIGAVRPPCDQ